MTAPSQPPRLRYDADGGLTEECLDWQDQYAANHIEAVRRYRAAVERFRADLASIDPDNTVRVCPLGTVEDVAVMFTAGEDCVPYTDTVVSEKAACRALGIMENV